MGISPVAILIIACGAPFACGLTGRSRAAPIAPGVLAAAYVVSYFQASPLNETRGVALFIAFVLVVLGACGWAVGTIVRHWRARQR